MTNPERRYHFYIMASRSRTLYCGVTSKLERRVWQHKNHRLSGFTDRYNIERLVYFERYGDIRNAISREKQIKRWSRQKKLALIERANPTWLDLSEGWYQENTVLHRNPNADPSTRAATPAALARDDDSMGQKG
jgi:putative endonuclease